MGQKKKSKQKFSGNHQRSWLWGYHAVREALVAGKWPILELCVTENAYEREAELIDRWSRAKGGSLQVVDAERLEELVRTSEHQGMIARLGPFPYGDMRELEELVTVERQSSADFLRGEDSGRGLPLYSLVVMCDRLQDSFNLGAILRCCDCANVLAVVVGEKSQAEMNSHVARASAGAINHLPIIKCDDLVAAAGKLKEMGLKLFAADSNAHSSMWDADLKHPAVLIIGSEAHGVDPRLLEICDARVVIPMQGHVDSLNAAVASGILLYEIRRQQRA